MKTDDRHGITVNIIGEKNLEYEVEQNFQEVRRLLLLLGISINTRFVHEITTSDLFTLPQAELNILRDPSLFKVGKTLQDLFGIPFLESFPVGLSGTLQFLRDAGTAAGIPYEHAISQEEEYQRSVLAEFSELTGSRVNRNYQLYPAEETVIDEIMSRVGLCEEKEGAKKPVPVPAPIGTGGVRRMLHCWRRIIA